MIPLPEEKLKQKNMYMFTYDDMKKERHGDNT